METHFPGETVSGIAVMRVKKPHHIIVTSVCRIAANEPSFLSFHLHIQDQRDKQKLNIKALDAVLFGPPTRKDRSLTLSCVFFYVFFYSTPEKGKRFSNNVLDYHSMDLGRVKCDLIYCM